MATVYFAQRGPYIKIGITRALKQRMQALRYATGVTKSPGDAAHVAPVRVLFTIPRSTLADERSMHSRFAEWHVVGEWFRADDGFLAELDVVRAEIAATDDAILRVLLDATAS